MTASDTALEGKQGYTGAFAGGAGLDDALDTLGRRWHITSSGIAVKPYPSCALTHSAIDALLDLRSARALAPERIAGIEVGVNRVVPDVLQYPSPATGLERKFSMQFCAAAALVDGRVSLDSFEDAIAPSPAVTALMPRITMVVDPALPDSLEQQAWTRVTVRLADGETIALAARGARGHPDHPLTDGELRGKFLGCARLVLPMSEADGVADQIAHFEAIPDIRALTSRLAGDLA